MTDLPNHATWIATGNNIVLSQEVVRRAVWIRLDAQTERPWERRAFRHPNLPQFIINRRGDVVAAALTLGRAWVAAGRPRGHQLLGTFEDWAGVMGGLLHVAGVPEFLANHARLQEECDSEINAMVAFVQAWWDLYGGREVGARELWRLVDPTGTTPIDLDLPGTTERALQTSLGIKLAQMRNRHFGPFRLETAGKKQRAQQWRLVQRVLQVDVHEQVSVIAAPLLRLLPHQVTRVAPGPAHTAATAPNGNRSPATGGPPLRFAPKKAARATPPDQRVPRKIREYLHILGYADAEIKRMRAADLDAVQRRHLREIGLDDTVIGTLSSATRWVRILTAHLQPDGPVRAAGPDR